ncbi:MAG TPA: AgmX/PglI C-terminal domain-containing protein [Candidatus Krumholzibacteria bacterium]|nr:AgmX/PglI C-terminal domain-containing protein [Candidatus Krumholzibacteria bacterium]
MTFAVHPVPSAYRQPLLGRPDPRFRRALTIAVALGALFLGLVRLAPAPQTREAEVEELPERLARLILEEPRRPTPAPAGPSTPEPKAETAPPEAVAPTTEAVEDPTPEAPAKPERRVRPSREAPTPEAPPERGTAGRARARTEVEQQLAAVTEEVDDALASLSSSLPTASSSGTASEPVSRRRGGRVRAGRGAGAATVRSTATATDLRRGGLNAEQVDLSGFGDLDLAGVTGRRESAATPTAQPTGDRSARSLMDTVRRYAPGIRFCYDTALESDPDLRGKMVFRITVAADGGVTSAEVVDDSLRSADVRSCALSQIRSWRFATASKASTFDAPFVFRPDE